VVSSLAARRHGRRGDSRHRGSTSSPFHSNFAFLAILSGLGQFLKVLLSVGPNLHNSARLDQRGNLLPALAVELKTLQKETMFFRRPTTRILSLGTDGSSIPTR